MHSTSSQTPPRVLAILASVVLAAGCTGTSASQAPGSAAPVETGVEPSAAGTFALPSFAPAALRWYCCLGTGEDPSQVPTENEVAAGFSTAFPGSTLKFEVTTYDAAPDTLSTQIAGGNSPDVVGPTGIGGLARFKGQWLDLAPSITKSNYDLSQFDPAAVDFYKSSDQGEIGIPFDVYPSMIWYKKDMFEEAGLDEPPHEYGAKYKLNGAEVDWNYDTVKQIALKLTVDKNNKDATEAGFDKDHIVQYGFEPQRDDLRGLGAYWGPGNLTGPDGKTVVIPDAWKTAWKFYYDGIWKDHFIMSLPVWQSDEFGGGEYAFFSGKVAMSENFLWTTYGVANAGTDWDLAAIPANGTTVTSPLNADTFAVLKGTKNPDAAFAALTYLLDESSDKLLQLYGGMPARPDKQDAFFEALDQSKDDKGNIKFPQGVDWQVAKDSVQYADNPNFEASMPKYNETLTILGKYLSKWGSTPGLNMDAEIDALQKEIQATWDSA
jgi:multiple sugar transport system substrate-binding protein